MALQQVENVKAEERDGTTYWTYEHLSQVGISHNLSCAFSMPLNS